MFNLYQYNTRSELTSAERYFGSSTNDTDNPVGLQDLGLQDWSYAYDNIGNRTWTTKANAAANYTANALNQYTERSVPGSSDIIGSAKTNVTVTVNEEEADRQGYYWSHRLTVDNLFNPIYTQVVVEAICDPGTNDPFVVSSETGSVFVAASPEEFSYDDDGNLLSDGRFNYSWDGENRLISATTKEGLPADLPIVHVEFAYDYMSRRIGKTVYQWDAGITNWVQTDARSFLYDGWLLVQEQSASGGNVTTNCYIHGLDLSGSIQGAGGIGGLLVYYSSSTSHPVLFSYDGNGNVSELLDFTNGMILAHYEYSPFGETIVATGPLTAENPFRFSTKYFDDETGLVCYGYRYYSPSVGKWISDDPLMDPGCLPVMIAKKQLLEMLEIYARMCAMAMLDEKLPDEVRISALYRAHDAGVWFDFVERSEPTLLLMMTGNNWLLFCGNNPVNFTDPLGLWNLWSPGSLGVANGVGWSWRDSINPFHESAGWSGAWEGAKGGAAAWADGFIPFFDPFENVYADECDNVDRTYKASRFFGNISRDALLAAGNAYAADKILAASNVQATMLERAIFRRVWMGQLVSETAPGWVSTAYGGS